MSKKKKRKVSKAPAAKSAPSISRKNIRLGKSAVQTFDPDYSYVIKDLKRIGVLAASFIIVLVILSFIL